MPDIAFERFEVGPHPRFEKLARQAQIAAQEVWARIPECDQTSILAVLDAVSLEPGSTNRYGAFDLEARRIRLDCYALNELSAPARLGVIVHEFGHAMDCHVRKIGPKRKGRDPVADRKADEFARQWGFENELCQLHAETRPDGRP